MSTRTLATREREIAGSDDNGASAPEVAKGGERASGPTFHQQPGEPVAKRKNTRISKKKLISGGIVGGVLLFGALFYWLHARNFQSTDDAYTTTHVHDISARVAGYVETVNVEDNEFVKAGQTLVVLDQRDFKVALEQAKAQVSQRRADVDQAQATF